MSDDDPQTGTCTETAETIHDVGKVAVADHARLMAENQRTLDVTRAADRRARDLHARIEEAKARVELPGLADSEVPARVDDEMKISIDSPVTTETHHHYPPAELGPSQPAKKTTGTLVKAALAAALLGTGAGGGVAAPWLMGIFGGGDKPAAVDTDTQYELRFGPPETPGHD